MLEIYIAAPVIDRHIVREYSRDLQKHGFGILNRWGNEDFPYEGGLTNLSNALVAEVFATQDLHDVMRCDIFVLITQSSELISYYPAGRMVQFGWALATGKTCVVIGDWTNVFCALTESPTGADVHAFDSYDDFREWILSAKDENDE